MLQNTIKVAVIDLYDNAPNQGMRGIQEILKERNGKVMNQRIIYDIYETRYKNEIPASDYDIYISTGGPGSPFDGEGKEWEKNYFNLVDKLWNHNQKTNNPADKKHIFFICHSFQMMSRFLNLGEVTKRKSTSFGVLPVHKTDEAEQDEIFRNLPEPYYVVDSRDWQVIQPNEKVFKELGASILSLEKIRPHVKYERAMMAIRVSDEFLGTQFHPEADPVGMNIHFQMPEKKKQVIDNFGEEKYNDMIAHLNDPDKIRLTYSSVIPVFINNAIERLRTEVLV